MLLEVKQVRGEGRIELRIVGVPGEYEPLAPSREGGVWHLWETVAVVAIPLGALAFSVYCVYLLDIVRLANPRVRRRRAAKRLHTTPSAPLAFGTALRHGGAGVWREPDTRIAVRRRAPRKLPLRRPSDVVACGSPRPS